MSACRRRTRRAGAGQLRRVESESHTRRAAPICRWAGGAGRQPDILRGASTRIVHRWTAGTGLPPAPRRVPRLSSRCCASSVDRDFDLFRVEKWKQARKCLQEEWVASILNEARETPDALERNLLYLLASLNGVLHPALLQLGRCRRPQRT